MDAGRRRLGWEPVSSAIELHSTRLGFFSLFDEANFEVVEPTRSITTSRIGRAVRWSRSASRDCSR